MELFSVGWVLRYMGFFYGSIFLSVLLFILAIIGVVLGRSYARKYRSLKNDLKQKICLVKYSFFLWSVWLLVFGIQYWIFNSFISGLFFALVAFVGALLISNLLVGDDDENNFLVIKGPAKVHVFLISSIVVDLVIWGVLCFHNYTDLITFTKEERANYYYNYFLKDNGDLDKYENGTIRLTELEELGVKHQPYFFAIAKLRMQKQGEVIPYFKDYANNLTNKKERLMWLAFGDFFSGEFLSAEKFFREAGYDYYALLSKLMSDKISLLDLEQFLASHNLTDKELRFVNRVKNSIALSKENLIISQKDSNKDSESDNSKILKEIRLLKDIVYKISELKSMNELLSGARTDVEKKMIEFAVKQAPPLPIFNMDAFVDSRFNILFVLFPFPFFILSMLVINDFIRNSGEKCDGKITEFFKAVRKKIVAKFGWHSNFARSAIVRLVKMEPEDEKGLFSKEIKYINEAVFPLDIFFGFWYCLKARRILVNKSFDKQENDDLLFIYNIIRKLSGKLIPQGDEQSLNIIVALREKAETCLQNHRKGQSTFLLTRDELLIVQKELITLGDILEVFGEKYELTNYHLLGLEPSRGVGDVEIKRAYRSVIRIVHPDHNLNNKFVENIAKLVNIAYSTLANPNKRSSYDLKIGL